MEDIIFILLAFGYLIYSLYKKSTKQKPEDKPAPQATSQEPKTEKKERDFETIFREIIGEEEDAVPKPKPIEAESQEVEQVSSSEKQIIDKKPEEFENHTGMTGVGDDFEFSAVGNIETIEDQLKMKDKEENEPEIEVIDLWESDSKKDVISELMDFDARKAIIYSEIINRKY